MIRESRDRKPEVAETGAAEQQQQPAAPAAKRGRRKDLSPEQARELQARQRAIGQELRRMFDTVAREPVPKELLDLVQEIDRKREN